MAEMIDKLTVTIVFDSNHAAASHWISMAEAALDYAWPSWRSLPDQERQLAKDQMMHEIYEAGTQNPVGVRRGIARPSPFCVRSVK